VEILHIFWWDILFSATLYILTFYFWPKTLRFERYRYWGIGYWPVLAGIGWYWYWPNTFLSNRAQYWADQSGHPRRSDKPQFCACVSIGLQSNACYADRLTADRGRHWWSDTQTPGGGVRVKWACEIWYPQLICHASRLSTPGDAQMTEAAWCRQHAPWLHQTASVVQYSGWQL